jgi:hypothetical protein
MSASLVNDDYVNVTNRAVYDVNKKIKACIILYAVRISFLLRLFSMLDYYAAQGWYSCDSTLLQKDLRLSSPDGIM